MHPESIKERIDKNNNNFIDTNEISDFIFDKNEGEKNLNDLGNYLNQGYLYETSGIKMAINNSFYTSQEWKKIQQDIQKKVNTDDRLNKKELSLVYLEMISNNPRSGPSPKEQLKFEPNKPIDQICDGKLIQFIRERYHAYMYTGKNGLDYALPDKYTFGHNITEAQKSTITNVLSGWKSPITAEMVADSCRTAQNVPVEYLLGFMQNDSRVGTMGLGAKTHNPGNVGNTGKTTKDRGTWEKGVSACADNLKKRIDAYMEAKKGNKQGFNSFPTPEELATGQSKGGNRFFGIYMTASDGPKKVAEMVKKRGDRLKSK